MPLTLGIAGTAKNTGKTTTTSAIIEQLEGVGLTYALTSIGYDGEEIDNVTGLPKPRLSVQQGQWAAVAEKCLKTSTAELKLVERTGIKTPLGEIIIGKVKKSGLLVIAGPNKGREVKEVVERLGNHGVELVLVDGALNRLAPMSITDGLIISTGASRHADIDVLVKEAAGIESFFQLPVYPEVNLNYAGENLRVGESEVIQMYKIDCTGLPDVRSLPYSSILTRTPLKDLLLSVKYGYKTMWVPGVISLPIFQEIVNSAHASGLNLILNDPTKLLVLGEPLELSRTLQLATERRMKVYLRHGLELVQVTVNPFYPRYRAGEGLYEPAYVDAPRLLSEMRKSLQIPVLDVKQDGVMPILEWIQARISDVMEPVIT